MDAKGDSNRPPSPFSPSENSPSDLLWKKNTSENQKIREMTMTVANRLARVGLKINKIIVVKIKI